MIEQHYVLSLLLREMGKSIEDLNQFEGRKYFQKIVYFAQQAPFGLNMGFGFSLHPHGPYSKELSECAKRILQQGQECADFCTNNHFRPEVQTGLEQLKTFAAINTSGLVGLDFLEVAATLHFLWTGPLKHLAVRERKERVIASCNELKPHFQNSACQVVFTELENWKLIAA